MKIVIGADIVPTSSNITYFESGEILRVLDEDLHSVINDADYRIFNIEAPITNIEKPINKAGKPKGNLRIDEGAIKGLSELNISVATLSNNHILDQGEQGLLRTKELLESVGVTCIGVGKGLEDAQRPVFLEKDGKKIGIYACAEYEFSIVQSGDHYGANPFDPLYTLDYIECQKKKCDYLIVLYHGGREFYRYPSPELQKRFRRMAEKGADLVIAQHTHCVGCYEEFNGSTLVYGQGNFIFDYGDDEYWNSGILIEVLLEDAISINFIPYIKNGGYIHMANEKERMNVLDGFFERSRNVANIEFVKKTYNQYSEEQLDSLLRVFKTNGMLFSTLNKILRKPVFYRNYKDQKLLSILNMIECESHREVIINGIKRKNPRE